MRRLHAVAGHEGFLASGRYVHYSHERPTGLVEHWSIHEVGGAQFIRVDHDGRDLDGRSLLIEALRGPDGHFERIDLRHYEAQQSKPLRLTYDFYQGHIEMIRAGGNIQRFALPPKSAAWLGSWILLGLALNPATERLLQWTGEGYSESVVTKLGQGVQAAAGHSFEVSRYRIEDSMTLALDKAGVALTIEEDGTVATLSEYARRP